MSKKLLELSGIVELDAKWAQDKISAEVVCLRIDEERIVYGRMATLFAVDLYSDEGCESKVKTIIVKRVVPEELGERDGSDADVFRASAEKEICFYKEKCLGANNSLFPQVYALYEREQPTFGVITVMEDCVGSGYRHIRDISPSTMHRVGQTLDAFVSLYQSEMQPCVDWWRSNQKLVGLENGEFDKKRGGFWVLSRRQADLESVEERWNSTVDRFGSVMLENQDEVAVRELGIKLARVAAKLDDLVRSRSFGFIHGDAKSWNLFYANEEESVSRPLILIDMQWCGYGHPLQDFCYFMTTSVGAGSNTDLQQVWAHWLKIFREKLKAMLKNIQPSIANIDVLAYNRYVETIVCDNFESFESLASIIWLDYMRVILLGLWRRLSTEQQEKNKTKIGISLVTSSVDQMKWILASALKNVDRVDSLLGNI